MNTFSVLMPLKDRVSYTRRIMNKWNSERFPYEIIIADGGQDLYIQEELSDKSNFENLNYTYIKYPFDMELSNFYAKMADAVMKIKTSTVMLMDNDDFIEVDGIKKCLEVLEDESYCSARGLMQDMAGNNMYSLYPDSIIADTAAERVIQQTKNFHSNWHNVAKTNCIQAMWKMIQVANPNNFRIVEQSTCYINTVFGNSYRGDFPWMHHEYSQRIKMQSGDLGAHFPSQEEWISANYWPEEFNKMTELVGAAISHHDKIPIDEALKIFRESYHFKLPHLKTVGIDGLSEYSIDAGIKFAKNLGYDYNRIDKMFEIMEECQV